MREWTLEWKVTSRRKRRAAAPCDFNIIPVDDVAHRVPKIWFGAPQAVIAIRESLREITE